MCHSLYKILGFVCVPTDTSQVIIGECFRASGLTLPCHREQIVLEIESRYSRVVFVCDCVCLFTKNNLMAESNELCKAVNFSKSTGHFPGSVVFTAIIFWISY